MKKRLVSSSVFHTTKTFIHHYYIKICMDFPWW